jgi:lipopolysaccharide export system protein LptA
MRVSVERLRWFLLAGALLLVGAVVVLLSYGRYRAVKAWKQIVARSGATITHEADEVTWSQAVRGKTIFTLHGAHVIPHGEGKYTLKDGMLLLYGADGQTVDRISGAQFEYDEKLGVAHAEGEVDMDIEPPKALSPGPKAKGPEGQSAQVIHVRTSGLTYVKKLGVAATDQEVEIAYGGMHGWAKGAEFDTGQSVVHLLADVRAEAELHGSNKTQGGTPVTLNAAKADLDRDADVIDLTAPRVESRGRVATAATAVLHLRKDGSLETVEARGAVTLKQGTRTITAPTLNAAMNENSQMEHAELNGGVALVDTSAARPMKGSAKMVKIACDGVGNPTSVVADGGAMLSVEQPRPEGGPLNRQMGADRMTLTLVKAAHGGAGSGMRVSAVHAEGNAWATGDAIVRGGNGKTAGAKTAGGVKSAGVKTTRVAGDDLRLALVRDAAGKDKPQNLSGTGHTRIEQRLPDGTVQTSGGETLRATFEPAKSGAGVEIASAEQAGHVEIHSAPGKAGEQPSEGVAESAALDGASDVLTLSGHPRFTRGDTSVSAETIRLMQTTGDAVAEGNVAATLVNTNAKPETHAPADEFPPQRTSSPGTPVFAGGRSASVTHVMAQQATLRKTAQTVEFTGTDAAPARMWQGASQVEAANLLLDRAHDSMEAWPAAANGAVRAVFASAGGTGADKPEGNERLAHAAEKKKDGVLKLKGDKVMRVTSARLDYSGVSHEAVFAGGVLAQGEGGQVRAQRGVAFLSARQGSEGQGAREPEGQRAGRSRDNGAVAVKTQPDPVASSLEKIVMSGAVKVQQPGRVGTGEQLLYTASTGEFVLTGTPEKPPHLVDDKQGNITGATLLFRSPDSTIVVAGEPASRRVHTETTIRK